MEEKATKNCPYCGEEILAVVYTQGTVPMTILGIFGKKH